MTSYIQPLLTLVISYAYAHPQCLDFRAPFKPTGALEICEEYQEFGCCTPTDAQAIGVDYRRIIGETRNLSLPTKCDDFVRALLCQPCSPYAAHLYDVESARGDPLVFPGLCLNYCIDLYVNCAKIIRFITNNQNVLSKLATTSTQFCTFAQASDVDYCYPNLLTNSVLNGLVSQPQVTREGCLCLEEFPAGPLKTPLLFRNAGDGSRRIFIGDRVGLIFVYLENGLRKPKAFLDLRAKVLTTDTAGEERGLLGLAFHPKYSTNGRFYVFYSAKTVDSEIVRISEFHVDVADPNRGNRTSERVLLEVVQPYWNHNGGEMLFGDDGYLYVSLGDGGSAGDPHGYAQNKASLLGKILRIDVDIRTEGRAYGVPADNPFVNDTQNSRPEIYAYGLRNVWRCGKDRGDASGRHKGRIICGDVGQSAHEEIDIIQKGGNYGWNAREGVACYKTDICGKIGDEIFPIYSYPHSVGKSVIGGNVYRGCLNPNLHGQYFYGDHVNGYISRLMEEPDGSWTDETVTMCGPDVCMNGLTGDYPPNIMTFGEDEYGELYMVTAHLYPQSTDLTGKVYKIIDPIRRGNPETCVPARPPAAVTASVEPASTSASTSPAHVVTSVLPPSTSRPLTSTVSDSRPSTRTVLPSKADSKGNGAMTTTAGELRLLLAAMFVWLVIGRPCCSLSMPAVSSAR